MSRVGRQEAGLVESEPRRERAEGLFLDRAIWRFGAGVVDLDGRPIAAGWVEGVVENKVAAGRPNPAAVTLTTCETGAATKRRPKA